jgi:hypothetical protein
VVKGTCIDLNNLNDYTEQSKLAKAARMSLEVQVSKAKREEIKVELQRLQALKANDMATYVQMLANTKNDRLQFLISQTDSFLQAINQKIQSERDKDDNQTQDSKPNHSSKGEAIKSETSKANTMSSSSSSSATTVDGKVTTTNAEREEGIYLI